MEPLIDAAWLAHVQGESGTAQARFLDCLELARQVDDRFIVGEALAGLSAVAGAESRWTDCAHFAGASARVHEQIGAPPWESVILLQTRQTSAAREALGPASYDQWEQRGRTQPVDDVVRLTRVAGAATERTSAR